MCVAKSIVRKVADILIETGVLRIAAMGYCDAVETQWLTFLHLPTVCKALNICASSMTV